MPWGHLRSFWEAFACILNLYKSMYSILNHFEPNKQEHQPNHNIFGCEKRTYNNVENLHGMSGYIPFAVNWKPTEVQTVKKMERGWERKIDFV